MRTRSRRATSRSVTAGAGAAVSAGLRVARWAVAGLFLANGALFGTWVSRIPTVAERLALSERQLGFALLGLAIGTLCALPLAGGLTTRIGARTVSGGGAALAAAGLGLVPLTTGTTSLFAALLVFGAGSAAMDVAMNGQAVALERRYGRSIVVAFHGVWSLGGLVATGIGAGTIGVGVPTGAHLTGAAVVLGALGLLAAIRSTEAEVDRAAGPGRVFSLPRRGLWLLGIVAVSSALAEGAVADWSGVHLQRTLGTSAATAALGFVAFSATMATVRFAGDRAVSRFGRRAIVSGGGLLATGGLVAAAVTATPAVALAGFAVTGVGLAAVVPVAFSAAGSVPGISEGEGVAAVATLGYAGFLAGPPLIGLIADATSLRLSLGLVAAVSASLILTGRHLPDP